ncbi:MAG: GNAT family N-acetyltransferase [Pseudomonadota bacterium]
MPAATAQAALAASLGGATAARGGALLGFGRIVGDGVLNLYIQDLIVAPEARRAGLGGALLSVLTGEAERIAGGAPALLGLFAAEGREAFYARQGFTSRPAPGYGAAMQRWIAFSRLGAP